MRLISLLFVLAMTACSPAGLLTLGVPGKFTVTHDVAYQEGGPQHSLDIYKPAVPANGHPVVVFFFGGAWQHGDKADVAFVAEPLAAAGITVVVPNYRLAPAVSFPAFIDDGAAAVAWTHTHAADYGSNPKNLFVMGHSAGAYIAAMLAVNPTYLAKVAMKPTDLAGTIGLAGPYNFLPITWPELKPIFAVPDMDTTQPITFVDGKNTHMLLLAGDADDTVDPIKNTDMFYHRILDRGGNAQEKLYPGVGHIGIVLSFAPLFRDKDPALADTLAFIETYKSLP